MSERSSSEVELIENLEDMHCVQKQSFVDEQEWRLYKFVDCEMHEVTVENSTCPKSQKVAMQVKCQVARRFAYFLWNIFLIPVRF